MAIDQSFYVCFIFDMNQANINPSIGMCIDNNTLQI